MLTLTTIATTTSTMRSASCTTTIHNQPLVPPPKLRGRGKKIHYNKAISILDMNISQMYVSALYQ